MSDVLLNLYREFNITLANAGLEYVTEFINLAFLILLTLLYTFFIWKLYQFMAAKNFLGKYFDKLEQLENSISAKLIYFFEYIIISPFLIFFWFIIFSIFLLLLTDIEDVTLILIIATVIISATRMASYINNDLAKEIAKLLPFTLLAIAITNPNFLNVERVLGRVAEIPSIFDFMWLYLLLIFLIEIIMRFFEFLFSFFGLKEVETEE